MNYYNEIDPFAAQWIRNLIDAKLIPPGDVDTRSIKEVMPDDIQGYTQCHFFAGITGWSLALEIAGVDATTPLWSGSCPCQPYSAAGKGRGDSDERNLWPEFFRLIRKCRPECVIGEQVENAIGHGWLDGVSADLEREGYAVGAIVLGAHSVGAPHIRQRLYWGGKRVADASTAKRGRRLQSERQHWGALHAANGGSVERVADAERGKRGRERREMDESQKSRSEDASNAALRCGEADRLALPNSDELQREPSTREQSLHEQGGGVDRLEHAAGDGREPRRTESERRSAAGGCEFVGMGDASSERLQERIDSGRATADIQRQAIERTSPWNNYHIIPCRDDKARRISAEPGDEPLAYGIPRNLGRGESKLRKLAIRAARANRVGRLKGYGNAICPQTAAEFVKAFMEANP